MKKRLLLCLWALLNLLSVSGAGIFGKVVDASTGKPLDAVTIFVSGTTRGTITKPDGSFQLDAIPAGAEKLVFDHMGYYTLTFAPEDLYTNKALLVKLKFKILQLNEVTVSSRYAFSKQDMADFLFAFFGNSDYGKKCLIKNPQVLHFKRQSFPHSPNEHKLLVTADSALIIENKRLGYTIRYTLESFSSSPNETYFKGYSLFMDNLDQIKNKSKILRAREDSYLGSYRHFLRSLYNKTLQQEGFRVLKLETVRDSAKTFRNYGVLSDSLLVLDTTCHMKQTELPYNIYENLIVSSDAASLSLSDPVEVRYIYSGEDQAYCKNPFYYMGMNRNYKQQHTLIRFTDSPFVFYSSGDSRNTAGFVTIGYWSYKKMGELLPGDYIPTNTGK